MQQLSFVFLGCLAYLACCSLTCCSAADNVLDLLVVVDAPVQRRWIALAGSKARYQKELFSTLLEVDKLFQSLCRYGVNLEIRVAKLLQPSSNILGSQSTGSVDANTALDTANRWLAQQRVFYDQALFFLASDLTYSSNGKTQAINGYTMIEQTCESNAISLVTAGYDYRTAVTATRVLAQSLSIPYDGSGNRDGIDCSKDDGYIMSGGNNYQSPNRWFFSKCSAAYLQRYIADKDRWCLSKPQKGSISLASRPRFGQLVGPDAVCKRVTGKGLVKKFYDDYENQMCESLQCLVRIEGGRYYMQYADTPQGERCAKGKRCLRGKCIDQNSTEFKNVCS